MRYQEPKYVRSANSAIRNKAINFMSTSSDMCIFSKPTYTMSGTTKIPCNNLACDFSGTAFSTLLDTTIDTCFTQNTLSTSTCLDSFSWNINVYEDSELSYSGTFLTTNDFVDTPTDEELYSSILTAFDTLGYTYEQNGSEFTIQRPYGVDMLSIDLGIQTNLTTGCTMTGSSECGCPTGYTLTVDSDDCIDLTTTAATTGGTFYTIGAGSTDSSYGDSGARFYEDITNKPWPIQKLADDSSVVLVDAANDPSPYPADSINPSGNSINTLVSSVQNSLWGTAGASTDGRLNAVGLWTTGSPAANEFIGFAKCIDIPVSGVYHVGLAADNYIKFKVNGETAVVMEKTTPYIPGAFTIWHMFPITLNSGKNIIEVEGADDAAFNAAFAAEIYSADTATLTAATSISECGLVFTTSGLTGTFETGDSSGYGCPTGYALDTCTGTPVCTQISRVNFNECEYSGSCSGDSSTLCTQAYDSIDSGSTGVYILSSTTGNIDITFNFTGNTSSFMDNNTTFKYDVYKYDNVNNIFNVNALYESEEIEWSSFSATSAITESIPVTSLNIDGDYLVKGYFTHDICTEFFGHLGETISSYDSRSGDKFGLYETARDYFFVAITEVDVPFFENASSVSNLGNLNVFSFFPEENQTTFAIPSNVGSSLILSLNGITLAQNYDYSLDITSTGSTVTLEEPSVSGDIITYAFVGDGTQDNRVYHDIYDIQDPIVSGVTDGEGTESVYYNMETGKYEVYTTITPRNGDDIYISLNGVTLANGIDYYQSITNPKRIILEGTISQYDIISVYYATLTDVSGGITDINQLIGWSIENEPQMENGVFTLELSSDDTFSDIVTSAQTNYVLGQTSYTAGITVSGDVGTTYYYRVKNEKNFESIKGDIITDSAYSEIIPITVNSNSINSY